MPSGQKDYGGDFSKKSSNQGYNQYSNKNQYRDESNYDYGAKVPSYPSKNTRNSRPQPQEKYDSYDNPPSYPSKSNVGKNTASTRGSNANRPQYKQTSNYDQYSNYQPDSNNREERSIKEVNR